MSLDTDVRAEADTQAVIRAKMSQIDLMTRILGCESDTARAALTGMSARQWQRARDGRVVGSIFIASLIAALRERERELIARNLRPAFDELFEVVVVAREAAR